MSEEDLEDVKENVQEWAENNFKGMKKRMEQLQDEIRNSKPRENINVRRVDSDNLKNQDTDQVVVEYKVERWYSIEYFRQMMKSSDEKGSDDGNIF